MRFLPIYRLAFKVAFVMLFPLLVKAGEIGTIDKPVRPDFIVDKVLLFTDSIPPRKKTEKQQEPEEKPRDIQDERLEHPERRAIKQVPRSIPKLKPQPVGERIKIRRPPIKIPKKGYRF